MTQDIRLRVALDRAAYALFQLKRFANMPQHAIDFCRESHAEACKVLDEDSSVVTEVVALKAKIEALPTITPSELDAEEQWRRNGKYVSLYEVLDLFTVSPLVAHTCSACGANIPAVAIVKDCNEDNCPEVRGATFAHQPQSRPTEER